MKDKSKTECMPACTSINRCEERLYMSINYEKNVAKPSLLLHSCCGPCSSSVIERLIGEFNITVFFYNPCITDESEYIRRKNTQMDLIDKLNAGGADSIEAMKFEGSNKIIFQEGPYEPKEYFDLVKGHEEDPEGGERCNICFRQRLEKTAEAASLMGFDYFGTTLTVSPHKNYKLISEIGNEIATKYGLSFLDRDFKKQDGFKRSIELSKIYNLYRQNYCGCVYSNYHLKGGKNV